MALGVRWLVVLTAAMAVLVPFALPARDRRRASARGGSRYGRCSLLGSAALAVSVAGIPHDWRWTAALLALGVVLVAVFIVVDRRDQGIGVAAQHISAPDR